MFTRMKGSNKNIVFLLLVLALSSVLILSPTTEANEEKKDGGGHDQKKDDKKAGGGDGKQLNCVKMVDKITNSKEKIDPAAKETCGKTENTQICEWTVMEMHRKEPQQINPKTITSMQMKVMKELIILTAKDCPAAGKDKAHEACAGSYKKAQDEMGAVKDVSNIGDSKEGVALVQGVLRHIQACRDVFDSEKVDSPLKQVNDFLTDTGENIVSLATNVNAGAAKAPA